MYVSATDPVLDYCAVKCSDNILALYCELTVCIDDAPDPSSASRFVHDCFVAVVEANCMACISAAQEGTQKTSCSDKHLL